MLPAIVFASLPFYLYTWWAQRKFNEPSPGPDRAAAPRECSRATGRYSPAYLKLNWDFFYIVYHGYLTLVMMGGGALCAPPKCFYFFTKISPPDQTLRPTCKFLILGILYHESFFLLCAYGQFVLVPKRKGHTYSYPELGILILPA